MSLSTAPAPGSTFTAEDGTVSTVLPENCDPHYEPTQEELEEYAEFIGIDPAKEPELLWIAKEGLRTPLPGEWRACQTNDDEVYYFNFGTGDSLWDHPMDETFKRKVTEERAKLQSGPSAKSASGGKPATVSPTTELAPKPISRSTAAPGSTKAISDALFAKPAAPAGGKGLPLAQPLATRPGLAQPLPTRLGGGPPGLSDAVGLSPGLDAAGALGGIVGRPQGFSSPPSPTPMTGALDIEANIRRRIEAEYEPRRRQMRIDVDKKQMEQKRAMEEDARRTKEAIEAAWAAESATAAATRARDTQRAVKEVEEGWQRRLKTLGDEVGQGTRELAEKQAALRALRAETAADRARALATERAATVAARRAALEQAAEAEVAQAQREQAQTLEELRRREAETLQRARTAAETESAKKAAALLTEAERSCAALEAEVAAKRAELAKVQAGTPTPAATPATDAAAQIAKAEAAAAEAIERERAAGAAALARLQEDEEAQVAQLQRELDALTTSAADPPAPPSPVTSTTTTLSNLSATDEEKLRREEDRLRRDMEASVRTFRQQTDALVLRQQRQRGTGAAAPSLTSPHRVGLSGEGSPMAGSTSLSAWGGVSSSGAAGASTPTPLAARLQQLESQHDERMRQLRAESKLAFTAKGLTNPRESEAFAKLFAERQRAWLAAHPAPTADSILPKLEPTSVPSVGMVDMPAVPPPTEEEVRAAAAPRLRALRAEHGAGEERALVATEAARRAELEKERVAYRERRLGEVRAEIARRVAAMSPRPEAAPAPAAQGGGADATAAAARARARAEEDEAHLRAGAGELAKLRAEVQACGDAVAQREEQHAARVRALTLQIAECDAHIARTAAELAEAKRSAGAAAAAAAAGGGEAATVKAPSHADGATTITTTGDAVPHGVVEVTQPDYVNFISADEAAAAEAAVHAKWRALLEGLRRDIAEAATASSAAPSASFATPILSRAGPDGEGGQPRGYQTPVMARAPYSVDVSTIRQASPFMPRAGSPEMNDRMAPAVRLGAGGGLSVMGTPPLPRHPGLPAYASPVGVVSVPVGARLSRSSPHVPAVSASAVLTPVLRPEGAVDAAAAYSQRLARLHALLRERRRSLRLRRAQLETLREEWRADVRRCRATHDREGAAVLKQVKARLEAAARELNHEVLSLKQAAARLQEAEGACARGVAPEVASSAVARAAGPVAEVADTRTVLESLMAVAERTERLEMLLLNQVLAQQRQCSSSTPEVVERVGAVAAAESQRQDPNQDPAAAGGRDGRHVEQWLREQGT